LNPAFLVTHTSALHAAIARHFGKGGRISLLEIVVNVGLRGSAISASGTRKGGKARTGINDHCLSLGRSADPQVDVMGTVAVVQGPDLQGLRSASEIAILFFFYYYFVIQKMFQSLFLQTPGSLDVMRDQGKGYKIRRLDPLDEIAQAE